MASSAKDIQLRELKDTISQLKTMMSEQTELIKSLRLIIEEKSNHEKALQEQVDYLMLRYVISPRNSCIIAQKYSEFNAHPSTFKSSFILGIFQPLIKP